MGSFVSQFPQWMIVQLGEDLNWWIQATNEEQNPGGLIHGVLDPRQVAHLTQLLDTYRPYGFQPDQLAEAFQVYVAESELDENQLRLVSTDESIPTNSYRWRRCLRFVFRTDRAGPYPPAQ